MRSWYRSGGPAGNRPFLRSSFPLRLRARRKRIRRFRRALIASFKSLQKHGRRTERIRLLRLRSRIGILVCHGKAVLSRARFPATLRTQICLQGPRLTGSLRSLHACHVAVKSAPVLAAGTEERKLKRSLFFFAYYVSARTFPLIFPRVRYALSGLRSRASPFPVSRADTSVIQETFSGAPGLYFGVDRYVGLSDLSWSRG